MIGQKKKKKIGVRSRWSRTILPVKFYFIFIFFFFLSIKKSATVVRCNMFKGGSSDAVADFSFSTRGRYPFGEGTVVQPHEWETVVENTRVVVIWSVSFLILKKKEAKNVIVICWGLGGLVISHAVKPTQAPEWCPGVARVSFRRAKRDCLWHVRFRKFRWLISCSLNISVSVPGLIRYGFLTTKLRHIRAINLNLSP